VTCRVPKRPWNADTVLRWFYYEAPRSTERPLGVPERSSLNCVLGGGCGITGLFLFIPLPVNPYYCYHMLLINPPTYPYGGVWVSDRIRCGGDSRHARDQQGRSDPRLPNDSVGRECRSSASRVPLSSNATTTGHGLYKLEMVVIVDLRMLAMYFTS
jgi:hypothetical protein